MRVSELAERAGTSAKTIRFYEAEGILPAPPRSPNGYRDYQGADVCRTRVLVTLRTPGIDLPEAGRLADLCATGHCDDMTELLAWRIPERRRTVAAAMAELTHLDAELRRSNAGWRAVNPDPPWVSEGGTLRCETSTVLLGPDVYDFTQGFYRSLPARLGEVVLMAALVYHALNGLRVTAMDFWPPLTVYCQPLTYGVVVATVVAMIPLGMVMLRPYAPWDG